MSPNRYISSLVAISLLIILLTGCAPQTKATPEVKQSLTGKWTSTVTKEDILRVEPGFDQQYMCDNTGTFFWTFKEDGSFIVQQTASAADCPASSNTQFEDKWSVEENLLTLAPGTPNQEIYEFSITNDQLTLKAKSSSCIPCIAINTANPWMRAKLIYHR